MVSTKEALKLCLAGTPAEVATSTVRLSLRKSKLSRRNWQHANEKAPSYPPPAAAKELRGRSWVATRSKEKTTTGRLILRTLPPKLIMLNVFLGDLFWHICVNGFVEKLVISNIMYVMAP